MMCRAVQSYCSSIAELEEEVKRLESGEYDGPGKLTKVASLLAWCGDLRALETGRQIHRQFWKAGGNRYIANLLVNMYGKCGAVQEARLVFEKIIERNVFSWSIIIATFTQNGHHGEALQHFHKMELEGVRANRVTLLSVVGACANIGDLCKGEELHSRLKSGEEDVVVENLFISVYGKCSRGDQAKLLFDKMRMKDLFSWTSMISALVHNGCPEEALSCFRRMELEGVRPSKVTFFAVLDACMLMGDVSVCRDMHLLIIEAGVEDDERILNGLAKMYGRCGDIAEMKQCFDMLRHGNVVSWTGLITAYIQNGCSELAVEQLHRMDLEGIKPNEITFVSVLDASGFANGAVEEKEVESIVERVLQSNFETLGTVGTTLVNLFGKLERLKEARNVFCTVQQRDTVSWNALISACSYNAEHTLAWHMFQLMILEGFQPDSITYVTVLDVCASLKELQCGKRVHECAVESGLISLVTVRNSLINMYSKCGAAEEAKKPFNMFDRRNIVSWNVMLSVHVHETDAAGALDLVKRMDLEGVKLDAVTLVSMADASAILKELEQCKVVHPRVVDAGYGTVAM